MKKRLIAVVAAVAVMSTVFVGCGKTEDKPADKPATKTETKTEAKEIKVGLVTDEGGVHDGSFNEAALRGIKKAASELKIKELNSIESKAADQYEPNIRTMASSGDLVVGAGFMMAQAMENVAKQTKDKKFVLIDGEVKAPNALSVSFKEHEGSFLAGVMAGKLTKSNKIGFVGGKEGDVIGRFESGFIAGVASVNPEAAKGLMPKDEKAHGTYVKYVDSFVKQELGEEAATMLYNQGVDIIFHAAGGVGLGVFKAAQKLNKFAVGVDSDQAVTAADYKNVILFSMEKKVDVAVFESIKDVQSGNFKGGVENKKVLGMKDNAVGIAPTLHANVTKESKELSDKAADLIKKDTIKVPGTLDELLKFKVVEIK